MLQRAIAAQDAAGEAKGDPAESEAGGETASLEAGGVEAGSAGALEGWNISQVANFSLDEAAVGGGGGGNSSSGGVGQERGDSRSHQSLAS